MSIRRLLTALVLCLTPALVACDPISPQGGGGQPPSQQQPQQKPAQQQVRRGSAVSTDPLKLQTPYAIDWKLGDVTGDGKADLVMWSSGDQPPIMVAVSRGTSFEAPKRWGVETCPTCLRAVADVNGDGKADILSFAWGEKEAPGWADVSVYLSTGSGLGARRTWHTSFCIREQVCHAADVNGDAKADLIAFTPITGLVWVSLSDGNGFGGNAVWQNFFCIRTERCHVGDVNGDRRADLIAFKPHAGPDVEKGNVLVAFAGDGSFGPAELGHGYFCVLDELCLVADMNGDRRTDIFLIKNWNGGQQALSSLSDGRRFVNDNPFVWSDDIATPNSAGLLADVSGDGKADLVVKDNADNGRAFLFFPTTAQGGCRTIRDPATGSCAVVDPEPETKAPPGAKGFSAIAIYNCHTDHRSVTAYVGSSSRSLDAQYNAVGTCPFDDNGLPAEPETFDLVAGVNEVAVVDPGGIGCEGRDDPTYQACLRAHFFLPGDPEGPVYRYIAS